jgi:hypothetical protein
VSSRKEQSESNSIYEAYTECAYYLYQGATPTYFLLFVTTPGKVQQVGFAANILKCVHGPAIDNVKTRKALDTKTSFQGFFNSAIYLGDSDFFTRRRMKVGGNAGIGGRKSLAVLAPAYKQ